MSNYFYIHCIFFILLLFGLPCSKTNLSLCIHKSHNSLLLCDNIFFLDIQTADNFLKLLIFFFNLKCIWVSFNFFFAFISIIGFPFILSFWYYHLYYPFLRSSLVPSSNCPLIAIEFLCGSTVLNGLFSHFVNLSHNNTLLASLLLVSTCILFCTSHIYET